MPLLQPHVIEAGSGPGVVCLHANASTSSQWRGLMETLGDTHRVLAPDAYGAGGTPRWPYDRPLRLSDEVALVQPVFDAAGPSFVLVGHSYGAAVALVAAALNPRRIRALALYEPTLFSILDAERPPPNDAEGIRETVRTATAALERGDGDAAAECFVDFWAGAGSWKSTPPHRRPAIAQSVASIPLWADALFSEPTPLDTFRRLAVPVLYLVGDRSPIATRAVAARLVAAFPRVSVRTMAGLGHMGPVTHPKDVNGAIAAFVRNAT